MRVIVPHTSLHRVTHDVLVGLACEGTFVEFVNVSGDDDAYRRLLLRLWQERETVIMVEHDVVPWPGALEELHACPADWCANSYHWRNEHGRGGVGLYHQLGCTKLSAELMAALPHVWDEPCSWTDCDRRLYFAARDIGKEPHPHRPPVIHLKGIAA